MAAPYYVQVLASNRASGSVFGTFTTAKSVINAADLVQLPANWLQIGTKFRIRVAGALACVGTTSGTVSFQVMMNTTINTSGVIAWTSGALQMTTTAETTAIPFLLEAVVRVTAVDAIENTAAATLLGQGWVAGLIPQLGAGAAVGTVTDSILMVPAAAPTNGTAFTSGVPMYLDFYTAFSISSANNSVQVYDYLVEQLQ
jgi:hypothetical protein